MITNSKIAWGDRLGVQMGRLATLFFLSRENQQRIVFFDELKNFRIGYQFLDVFDLDGIEMLHRTRGLKKFLCKFYCRQFYEDFFGKELLLKIYYHMGISEERYHEYICRLYKDFSPVNGSGGYTVIPFCCHWNRTETITF